MMSWFDYLETKWVEANTALQKEMTVAMQAKSNASIWLVSASRKVLHFFHALKMIWDYALIRLHIRKAPAFQSSMPPVPSAQPAKPTLVPDAPAPQGDSSGQGSNTAGTSSSS